MGRKRRLVMTGGGTAGHVMPNIALLPELQSEDYLIAYIGSYDGIEKDLIKEQHLRYYGISSGRLRRYFSLENFTDPFRVIKGYRQAKKILKQLKPDVVFSKGGFVSVPVVVAAGHLNIPVIIHESDMTPGLANKIAMKYASKICCTFPETIKYVPEDKAVLTGTPIRDELVEGDKQKGYLSSGLRPNGKPVLLVVGGSTGAHNLNVVIRKILPKLLSNFQIIHLCGAGKTDPEFNNIKDYVQMEYAGVEMKDFLALADIVVSRAGANAIFELLSLRKPNLLVPLSASASRGDQILNAKSFKASGYSEVLEEESITPEGFLTAINNLYANRNEYIERMQKSELLDAIPKIVDLIDTI